MERSSCHPQRALISLIISRIETTRLVGPSDPVPYQEAKESDGLTPSVQRIAYEIFLEKKVKSELFKPLGLMPRVNEIEK